MALKALADKVHKTRSAMHNHLYISSSGTPVGTKFTATYVGMVVE